MGASSRTLGMKSGVQPWIGCAANAGWLVAGEPSALRSCRSVGGHTLFERRTVLMPEASKPAASGSASTIFTSGMASLRAFPAPWKVPEMGRDNTHEGQCAHRRCRSP